MAQAANKLGTGSPWYGYATQVGYLDVLRLANRSAARPTHPVLDRASMTMHFDYFATNATTGEVRRHQVWYDDPNTLAAKYDVVAAKHGKGVAMWTANNGDDAMWDALRKALRV